VPDSTGIGRHRQRERLVLPEFSGFATQPPWPPDVKGAGGWAIGGISLDTALWRIWPYTGALVAVLIIGVATPWLSIGFLH
jgi:hypothetical protein